MDEILLKNLQRNDIPKIVQAFTEIGWHKPTSIYETYIAEQNSGERKVIVAWSRDVFIGYVTIKWESEYPPFREKQIPEIKDLNVLPHYRRQGVGSALLDLAESMAFERASQVGLGAGLLQDYQDGFRLYLRRGYLPDGEGLYHPNLPRGYPNHGDSVSIDDDCNLWLTKPRP